MCWNSAIPQPVRSFPAVQWTTADPVLSVKSRSMDRYDARADGSDTMSR